MTGRQLQLPRCTLNASSVVMKLLVHYERCNSSYCNPVFYGVCDIMSNSFDVVCVTGTSVYPVNGFCSTFTHN